jgi:hypothetical protein
MSITCGSCCSPHPDLVSKINEPMFGFKSPAVHVARTNPELLDLLLAMAPISTLGPAGIRTKSMPSSFVQADLGNFAVVLE